MHVTRVVPVMLDDDVLGSMNLLLEVVWCDLQQRRDLDAVERGVAVGIGLALPALACGQGGCAEGEQRKESHSGGADSAVFSAVSGRQQDEEICDDSEEQKLR